MGKKRESSNGNSQEHNSTPEKQARTEPMSDVQEWDIPKVTEFLAQHGLDPEHIQPFIDHRITGAVLGDLTEKHLEEMGILIGDRLRLLQALREVTGRTNHVRTPMVHEEKVFNDPIHGHITMHPLCVKIIDTPQFQRLRYLLQLGGCYFVFPGASHHRFEHCIGVGHLARELAVTLQQRQPELNITDKDVLCVQIAGLCHDLGHGPFSHMFDGSFIPAVRPGYEWKHEDASVLMFEYLVEENKLIPEFEKYGLTEQDRKFITEQIKGPTHTENNISTPDWKYVGRTKEKSFLYEIVANKRNGIDVDKWDYFARDCYHLGMKNNFDHNRFMKFARVLDVDGDKQICSRDKYQIQESVLYIAPVGPSSTKYLLASCCESFQEVSSVYAMFHARTSLHRRAYQHKTSCLIDTMITEALIKANHYIKIPGKNGAMRKMSECIDDMEAYTKLTDHVFHQILLSTEPKLKPAKDILHKVQCRKLYKCIGQSRPHDTNKKFKQTQLEELKTQIVRGSEVINTEMIHIQLVSFDYGMKGENPIDRVRFYKKSNPSEGVQIRKEEASKLLPSTFYEQYVRLYCKSNEQSHLDEATRCFKDWCKSQDYVTSTGGDMMSAELTPLKLPNGPSFGKLLGPT